MGPRSIRTGSFQSFWVIRDFKNRINIVWKTTLRQQITKYLFSQWKVKPISHYPLWSLLLCFPLWSLLVHSMATSSSIWFKEACLWRHVDSPLFQFPSLEQHGKEGSQEGSSRGPKGDESDEGQESMKVSNMKSYAMLLAGWYRSFQVLARCIWAHTCDALACIWIRSVAMAGVEQKAAWHSS